MERSRSSERSSSGAVEMRLRIWLMAWVRLRRAEDRATLNIRMASTFPVLVLADPSASPPWAARAADTGQACRTCPGAGASGGWADPLRPPRPPGGAGGGSVRPHSCLSPRPRRARRSRRPRANPTAPRSPAAWSGSSWCRAVPPVRPALPRHGRRGECRPLR